MIVELLLAADLKKGKDGLKGCKRRALFEEVGVDHLFSSNKGCQAHSLTVSKTLSHQDCVRDQHVSGTHSDLYIVFRLSREFRINFAGTLQPRTCES